MHISLSWIAALTIAVSSLPVHAQWVKTTSSQEATSYISTQPIMYKGRIARTQLLTDMKEPEVINETANPSEKPSRSFVLDIEFDCFNRAARIKSATAYSDAMGKGEVTVDEQDNPGNPLSDYWNDIREWGLSKEFSSACRSIPVTVFNRPPERIWLEIDAPQRSAETPPDDQTIYLDLNSKVRKDAVVRISQLVNLNEALLTNDSTAWMSAVLKLEFECKRGAMRDMKISIHPDRMAEQQAIVSGMGTKEWLAVEPNSNQEEMFKVACEN